MQTEKEIIKARANARFPKAVAEYYAAHKAICDCTEKLRQERLAARRSATMLLPLAYENTFAEIMG
jgi:hypothetical protein